MSNRAAVLAAAVFLLALGVRVAAYELLWPDRLHGTSAAYASAALGILHGQDVTSSSAEILAIRKARGRLPDFRAVYRPDAPRDRLYMFLPGGPWIMAGVWQLTGVYNFRPYVYLQAVLDSLLAVMLLALLVPHGMLLAAAVAAGWALFLPQVRLVCTPSYDLWPAVGFVAGVWAAATFLRLRARQPGRAMLALVAGGVLAGAALWMREIMIVFPFLVTAALVLLLRREPRQWPRAAAYLAPFLVFLGLLMAVRAQQTHEARPTRGVFWHSFWAGVGQFPNPYGIRHQDESVHAFAERLNPRIRPDIWYDNIPDNIYERTLEQAAYRLIRERPLLLVRNACLRAGMVLAPTLYPDDAFFASPLQRRAALVLGLLLLPLQVLGLVYLARRERPLLWLLLLPLASIILTLAPFYLVGRALVSVFFVHMALTALGVAWLLARARRESVPEARRPAA